MHFEIISKITHIKTIAVDNSIRDIKRLRKEYGAGRWRKLKGMPCCVLKMEEYVKLKSIGMKLMALGKKK
ncbi:hypothetical protein GMMP15_1300007 [Candidatus Magnetomoraceae bacterium gMMP-15]